LDAGEAADQIAHIDRLVEFHGIDRHGDHRPSGVFQGDDAAGHVHLGHDPTPENLAAGIGVGRHRQNADGRLPVPGEDIPVVSFEVGHHDSPEGDRTRFDIE